MTTKSGLRPGTRVLYAPTLGGKTYAGVVASEPWILGGHSEVVRLEQMEDAYGNETGRPGRRSVPAAAVSHVFIEADE